MTATKGQTIKGWLKGLVEAKQSDRVDAQLMQGLLVKMGYARAVVVCGIVYLEGKGTIDAPPQSIHAIAKVLYEAMRDD